MLPCGITRPPVSRAAGAPAGVSPGAPLPAPSPAGDASAAGPSRPPPRAPWGRAGSARPSTAARAARPQRSPRGKRRGPRPGTRPPPPLADLAADPPARPTERDVLSALRQVSVPESSQRRGVMPPGVSAVRATCLGLVGSVAPFVSDHTRQAPRLVRLLNAYAEGLLAETGKDFPTWTSIQVPAPASPRPGLRPAPPPPRGPARRPAHAPGPPGPPPPRR